MKMKFKKLSALAATPTYAHDDDAGMDLYASTCRNLSPGERSLVQTDIAVEIPQGYFGLLRPRSGLATKFGVTTCSSDVIDAGYRGELKVGLINLSDELFMVDIGMRIAQLLILPVLHVELEEVEELSDSIRGVGGHGSTGV